MASLVVRRMQTPRPSGDAGAVLNPAPRPDRPGVAVVAADRRVRDSLASLLAATGRVEILGLAIDSPAALRLSGERRPDVILVDPSLADVDGGTVVAELRHQVPGATILLVEWDDRSGLVVPRWADGVLDVGSLPGALLAAIDPAARGSD